MRDAARRPGPDTRLFATCGHLVDGTTWHKTAGPGEQPAGVAPPFGAALREGDAAQETEARGQLRRLGITRIDFDIRVLERVEKEAAGA